MKPAVYACIVSLTVAITSYGYGQPGRQLPVLLKTAVGNGAFKPLLYSTELVGPGGMNYDPERQFAGIPGNLSEMIIKQLDFQPEQGAYEFYIRLHGRMQPGMLMQELSKYRTDTLALSRTPIKHMVFFLSGINKNGKRVIITDTNNNLDFGDESVFEYDTAALKAAPDEITARLADQTVYYQYAYRGKVYDRSCHLKVSPVPSYYQYRSPVETRLYLVAWLNEHQAGVFTSNGKTCMIQAGTNNQPRFAFTGVNTSIRTGLPAAGKEQLQQLQEEYLPGDTFTINRRRYVFSNITVFGDTLWLSYVGKGAAVYGADSGKIAYNIAGTDLEGRPFDLGKLKGRYVLIDFWGTWCRPCIHIIPDLVRMARRFKNKLQIVSIAYDSPQHMPALKAMITEKHMSWTHLFQDMSAPDKKPVINQYRVNTYPTQILIDPEGRILSRITSADQVSRLEQQLERLIKE